MALDTQAYSNYCIPTKLPRTIFRAYDIRGEVSPDALNDNVAYAVGRAFGTALRLLNKTDVVLGCDARASSPGLKKAMSQGLRESGIEVTFIGLVPSPLVYFATHHLPINSGIMITGSHNPKGQNGIKMVLDGSTLTSEAIQSLYARIEARDFIDGEGVEKAQDILDDYFKCIASRIQLSRPLHIVIDAGNGMAALTAKRVYESLGCKVTALHDVVDGDFPNHHPDPSVPKNLQDLIAAVQAEQADCGLAFDGDADRLGVVSNVGEIIWPDRQMMLFSKDVLSRYPGAPIVFDVKCSNHLADVITQYGGVPIMWQTGHSILKAKLFAEDAPLAGEMSGHIFFRDNWFGFDDGVYDGARLLAILADETRTCSEVFTEFPQAVSTPEIQISVSEEKKRDVINRLLTDAQFGEKERITIDGLRLHWADSWALIRASNTTPCLTLRFEADTQERLDEIQTLVYEQLRVCAGVEV